MSKEYRLVVAGCRDFDDYARASAALTEHIQTLGSDYSIIVVSGGASGADALGERFAREQGLSVEQYPADWERYGRAAGPQRNAQMANAADGVLVFWDGMSRGTKSMILCAKKAKKPCKIINI